MTIFTLGFVDGRLVRRYLLGDIMKMTVSPPR